MWIAETVQNQSHYFHEVWTKLARTQFYSLPMSSLYMFAMKIWTVFRHDILGPVQALPLTRPTRRPLSSGATSPKIWEEKKIGGEKMFHYRRILFCLEKRLLKHKMTVCSRNLVGGMAPWLRLSRLEHSLQGRRIRFFSWFPCPNVLKLAWRISGRPC